MKECEIQNGTIIGLNQEELNTFLNNVHPFFIPKRIERYKDNTIVVYWIDGSSTLLHMSYEGDVTDPNYRVNEFAVAVMVRMFNIPDPYIEKFYEKEMAVDKTVDYNSLPNLNGRHPKKGVIQ